MAKLQLDQRAEVSAFPPEFLFIKAGYISCALLDFSASRLAAPLELEDRCLATAGRSASKVSRPMDDEWGTGRWIAASKVRPGDMLTPEKPVSITFTTAGTAGSIGLPWPTSIAGQAGLLSAIYRWRENRAARALRRHAGLLPTARSDH